MLYWRWDTATRELTTTPAALAHAHSNQLKRVSAGDTLWIVCVPPSDASHDIAGQLMLIGRLPVAFCTSDRADAARFENAMNAGAPMPTSMGRAQCERNQTWLGL